MRHVVFVTGGIVSVRNVHLGLARRLADRGFRVTYTSPVDMREAVESQGFPFVHLAAGAREEPRRSLFARLARMPRLRARRLAEIEGLGVAQGMSQIEALAPDVILVDLELHAYVIGATALRVPMAIVSVWLALSKHPGLAPLHRFLPPAPGLRRFVAIEFAWLRYRLWKLARRKLDWLRRKGVDRVSVLRVWADQNGFPFRDETELWQWPHPFSYGRLPLLLCNASEFDLPHTAPRNVRYVGPMMVEPVPGPPTDEIERILARRALDPVRRPLVYAAFGSFFKGDDTGFIGRFLAAIRERPDWEIVVALGGRLSPDVFGSQPSHVNILGWVPQTRAISQADAAVLHGGITSINESLWFGVPMLVYPLKTNDQLGTAVRVEHHGVGIVGDRDVDTVDDIHRKLDDILTDSQYRRQAKDMSERVKAYDRRGVAVAAIEEVVGSWSGGAPHPINDLTTPDTL